MEEITHIKGTNGVLYVYEDRIVISRKTFGGFAAFGVAGDKIYFYNSIQGVELSGNILRIIPKGADAPSYNGMSLSSVSKAQKDSNALLLIGTQTKLVNQICETITQKVNETSLKDDRIKEISIADEIMKLKKLLDEGIITQEQFERKKQELLK